MSDGKVRDDGGAAFPLATREWYGMSLRDWLAGQALVAIFAARESTGDNAADARNAYGMADSMLKARAK